MKILFINPSLRRGAKTKLLPVGIGYIMTYVHENGYDFDLLDVDIDDLSDEEVDTYIRKNRHDLVLTGCIVTNYKWMKWLTRIIRNYHPDTKIIVGNSVAGSAAEVFLRNSNADFAVIGEGEITTLELLSAIRDGNSTEEIEGIAYINGDGVFIKNPKRKAVKKIDDFPMINWNLFNVQKYIQTSDHAYAWGLEFDKENPPVVMPVSTARGCAFKCSFCHYVFWDDPYRHRSTESILKEVKRNIDEYGATYINFWDDLSFASLKQAENLADGILDSGLKFSWDAAIRSDLFGHPRFSYKKRIEVAKKFKEAGCKTVSFSLETGNPEILEMMNKRVETEYFKEQAMLMKEVGIEITTSIVFGYPLETPETIQQTFDMCLDVQVYPSIGYLLPLPYTGMYNYAKENGFIIDEDAYLDSITERQDFCLNMTKMSDEEVMREIKDGAMRLNQMLELGLSYDKLVKTGGYREHTKLTAKKDPPLDPENLVRNENDVSFNYSQAVFADDMKTQFVASEQIKARNRNK